MFHISDQSIKYTYNDSNYTCIVTRLRSTPGVDLYLGIYLNKNIIVITCKNLQVL